MKRLGKCHRIGRAKRTKRGQKGPNVSLVRGCEAKKDQKGPRVSIVVGMMAAPKDPHGNPVASLL